MTIWIIPMSPLLEEAFPKSLKLQALVSRRRLREERGSSPPP